MYLNRLCRCLGLSLLIAATSSCQTTPTNLDGFSPRGSTKERIIEKAFMAVPDPASAAAHLKVLTAEPHIAGSPGDRRTAEYVLQQFRRYGLDAEIEEFQAQLSEPSSIHFDLLAPVSFSGPSREFVGLDPASRDAKVTTNFNAFSASGEVTSEVIYANYGSPGDFEFLRSAGIPVEGKIVIVRYGQCYRGVKAMMAERNKAAALIIYSDPQEDGYHKGNVYPVGPWRPESGVQRGSVLYDFIYPGVKADGSTVPHIPVMPLSYGDAKHILQNLTGSVAPPDWQGALPFTYHLGPGAAKVHLDVQMKSPVRTIWNVVAKIPGDTEAEGEEIVVAGNHRDAWVYGASDPSSGTTAMLEMARGLGALLKTGWHPHRSIWLCSWDAEEPDEFGSTMWTEKHSTELKKKAIAYLDLDSAVGGDRFVAAAAPSLKRFMLEVAADVPDPVGGSVLERANEQLQNELRQVLRPGSIPNAVAVSLNQIGAAPELRPISEQTIEIGNLGSGTDFVSFFDHLGIPATDFGFDGPSGVYHSIFDDYRWMEKFGDPHFTYHVAAARFYGLEVLRLSGADLLPLDYEEYGQEIQKFTDGIHRKLVLLGQDGRLDFAPAIDAAKRLTDNGRSVRRQFQSMLADETRVLDLHRINRALVDAEKAFLLTDGLPGRPWFKHAIFAPALYNGYDAAVMPGVLESIDAGNWHEAQHQLRSLTDAVNLAAKILNIEENPR